MGKGRVRAVFHRDLPSDVVGGLGSDGCEWARL